MLAVVAVLVAVEGQLRTPGRLVFAILPLVAGAGIAWQAAINGRLREAGGVLPVTFVNAAVGTVALLIAFAVAGYVRGWPAGALPREPWLYVGGPLGIVVIASSVIVVRQIGVLLLALGFVAGQVVGALGADIVAPGSAGPPGRATILSAALTLVAVLIAAYRSAGPPPARPPWEGRRSPRPRRRRPTRRTHRSRSRKTASSSGIRTHSDGRRGWEVLLAVLAGRSGRRVEMDLLFPVAQLDPADLAGDRLRQVGELQPPDPKEGRQVLPAVREDRPRRRRVRFHPAASTTYAFGTASRRGSGDGTTAASATASCSISTLSSSNGEMR